jgi:hypothetical protein
MELYLFIYLSCIIYIEPFLNSKLRMVELIFLFFASKNQNMFVLSFFITVCAIH